MALYHSISFLKSLPKKNFQFLEKKHENLMNAFDSSNERC